LLQDEKGNPYLIDFGYSLSVKGDGEKHKYDGTFCAFRTCKLTKLLMKHLQCLRNTIQRFNSEKPTASNLNDQEFNYF